VIHFGNRISVPVLAAAAWVLGWSDSLAAGTVPDLSGVWLSATAQEATDRPGAALFDARGSGAPGGKPQLRDPYRADYEAREARQEAKEAQGQPLFDSETQCKPDGMPKMMRAFLPLQIVQTPSLVVVLAEELQQIRRIYLNEKMPALTDLTPNYNGFSVGHWEGDTLVVRTTAVRPEARFLDLPHSEKLTLTERLRLLSPQTLEDHIVIEDPVVLARPYSFTWRYRKDTTNYKLSEYVCDNNRYQGDSQGNAVVETNAPPQKK